MCIIRLYLKHFPIVQPQQWGSFTTTAIANTISKGFINYLITYKNFSLPFGILNGHNTETGNVFFTLENPTLNGITWVIGGEFSLSVINNRWIAIGI